MADNKLKLFEYDKAQIGEALGSYEYTLTQEMVDAFRKSVEDPDAQFPTLGVKHDATASVSYTHLTLPTSDLV